MPDLASLLDLARLHMDTGDFAQARQHAAKAIATSPRSAQAHAVMAMVLTQQNDRKAALFYAEKAAALEPDNPAHASDLASLRSELGQHDQAVTALQSLAVKYAPPHVAAYQIQSALIAAYLGAGRIAEAETACRTALAVFPRDEGLTIRLAAILVDLAMPDESLATLSALRQSGSTDTALIEHEANISNYASLDAPGAGPNTPEAIFNLHAAVGRLLATIDDGRPRLAPAKRRDRAPATPIRLGIISADLRTHAVANFFEPLARHLDPRRIELVVYSLTKNEDAVTARLKPLVKRWRSCAGVSLTKLDALIRSDSLDAAMELGGYTGLFGLAALRDRPAPCAITYLGYPNTTGCPYIDARIVDELTDPPGSDRFATEKLHRLTRAGEPWPFLCYHPDAALPPLRSRPPLTPGAPIVFGCYTAILKVCRQAVALWTGVMRAVPDAGLIVKSPGFRDPLTRRRIAEAWAAQGLPMDRVELRPPVDSYLEHLDSYHDLHIALDPTPYNGTTSTCDALAMGTPVLALRGSVHAARVSASILTHSGLGELVADTPEQYAQLAADLAADHARLARLHATVRDRFLTGKVCDGPGFCRVFEETIEQIVAASQGGRVSNPAN